VGIEDIGFVANEHREEFDIPDSKEKDEETRE
jgi:hypothetical protein